MDSIPTYLCMRREKGEVGDGGRREEVGGGGRREERQGR